MGRLTDIEWAHHTFNPWWGCTKVSEACRHCYAETIARRWSGRLWGKKAPRRTFGARHWKEPLSWNRAASRDGRRRRVFCASMADVFEDFEGHPLRAELETERQRFFSLIEETEKLDWMLLTKRPQNVCEMVPWKPGYYPSNLWIGTTVEDQPAAEERLPYLYVVPASVRFVSCEPLLGPVDLSRVEVSGHDFLVDGDLLPLAGIHRLREPPLTETGLPVDWVITGGESGPHARPSDPAWFRTLRDQCAAAQVPFFFKQWGAWKPHRNAKGRRVIHQSDGPGRAMTRLVMLGKQRTGRALDGKAHEQVPRQAALSAAAARVTFGPRRNKCTVLSS